MNLLFKIEDTPAPNIEGLLYIPDFISASEEQNLIHSVDQNPWLNDLKRRVQHYGYKYDYKARRVGAESFLGPLPEWVAPFAHKLHANKFFPSIPDQAIVNEYQPGQGISAHIDCVPCFEGVIASLSLCSGATMQLANPRHGIKHDLYLQPRSLILLSGEARYQWTHAIPARKSDHVNGFKIERERRVSLTFRSVILD
jgi:alkylated DNA repair dioxygenase AlkB